MNGEQRISSVRRAIMFISGSDRCVLIDDWSQLEECVLGGVRAVAVRRQRFEQTGAALDRICDQQDPAR